MSKYRGDRTAGEILKELDQLGPWPFDRCSADELLDFLAILQRVQASCLCEIISGLSVRIDNACNSANKSAEETP